MKTLDQSIKDFLINEKILEPQTLKLADENKNISSSELVNIDVLLKLSKNKTDTPAKGGKARKK